MAGSSSSSLSDVEDAGSSKRNSVSEAKAEMPSLKRGRAESVEPAPQGLPSPSTYTAPKKNRVAPSTGKAPSKPMDPILSPNLDQGHSRLPSNATGNATGNGSPPLGASDDEAIGETSGTAKASTIDAKAKGLKPDGVSGPNGKTDIGASDDEGKGEGSHVGEVRRKVQEMTYEEGNSGGMDEDKDLEVELPEKDEDAGPDSAMTYSTRLTSLPDEYADHGDEEEDEDVDDEYGDEEDDEGEVEDEENHYNDDDDEEGEEAGAAHAEVNEGDEDEEGHEDVGEGWQEIEKSEADGSEAYEDETAPPSGPEGLKRKALERSGSSQAVAQEVKKSKESPETAEKSLPPSEQPTTAAPKKPETTFSSFSSTSSPFATVRSPTGDPLPAPEPAKKPQSTFASFSSASSPLAAPKASTTDAPPPTEAPDKKPQSTFASFSNSSPFSTAGSASPYATAGASGSTTSKPLAFAGSGFGSYTNSASPFAKKSTPLVNNIKGSKEEDTAEDLEDSKAEASSFGDILKAGATEEETEERVHMTEQDVHTGEEDEETRHQIRTKLYAMQADGGWKERGVGTLRLNVRYSDGKGARLVMRAEGSLRLMLNVSLYVGMTCLEDGKHVRTTVVENGQRTFLTFRTSSNKAASDLCMAIQECIPLESASSSKSPAPDIGRAVEEV